MSAFLDGPAEGSFLSLKRSPIFLRVVIDEGGKVDALDLLTDAPEPTEAISVYMIASEPVNAMTCSRSGRGKGCDFSSSAEYKLYPEQPAEAVLRDRGKWQTWCREQKEKNFGEELE